MTASATISCPFEPGMTSWCVDDLQDPEIERRWETGSYEIVERMLTNRPPAFFDGSSALYALTRLVDRHFEQVGLNGRFAPEADLILSP